MDYKKLHDLLEFIAKGLVNDPESVKVDSSIEENTVHLKLSVATEDIGRVIGKQGRVANSIRHLLRAAASREGMQVIMDVVEPE
ncbi:MAG TPA: KH domain-containing protein [Anaerolineaceae bacterium]|jgi:predicted RNA-binding protein YlqC (UPF0109 family)|nr:KH domain-containing protein [Anaerolineaceae bacterium]HNZ15429.1 KH domain-containing protein [Anaerolineaceae bacterium]HOH92433.1 KH domain-containing protein [Anaerolineaceae bacterium]HPX66125.1 KH domain-containing protein [Anaerolineaceae bacterium]HQC64041.1 KH domain-containing protein [Anaerolineaceae bacterium]